MYHITQFPKTLTIFQNYLGFVMELLSVQMDLMNPAVARIQMNSYALIQAFVSQRQANVME